MRNPFNQTPMEYILAHTEPEPTKLEKLQKRANSVPSTVEAIPELRDIVREALSLASQNKTATEYKQLAHQNNELKRKVNSLLDYKKQCQLYEQCAHQAEREAKRVEKLAMGLREERDILLRANQSQVRTIETLLLANENMKDALGKAKDNPENQDPVARAMLQAKRDSIRARARIWVMGILVMALGFTTMFLFLWMWLRK